MKKNLVYLLCMIALLTSCSSAYRTSQTPDDVYYSPGQNIDVQDRYESYASSNDDYYLRMKANNYNKWNALDDYDYWYDSRYYYNNYYSPYTSYYSSGLGIGIGLGYNMYPYYAYSPYWYNPWHSWYNPYYTVVYYKNPSVYYKPVRNNTNFTGYTNRNYNTRNMPLSTGNRRDVYNSYNNSNSRSNNRINVGENNYNQNRNNNSTPVRTFNNSNSSSSGSPRVSGGGGGRVRP